MEKGNEKKKEIVGGGGGGGGEGGGRWIFADFIVNIFPH